MITVGGLRWIPLLVMLCSPCAIGGGRPGPLIRGRLLAPAPKPAYPETARAIGLGGTVKVAVSVDERGRVAQVEILEAPESRFDSWRSIQQEVRGWHYTPSTRDGKPVAARFEYQWRYESEDWPKSMARIYPRRAREVYDALSALFKAAKIRTKIRDDQHGILMARKQRFEPERFPGLASFSGTGLIPQRYTLSCVVPPYVEPARVYCNAAFFAQATMATRQGRLEGWVLDRLDERLGVAGEAIPADAARRSRLARRLGASLGVKIPLLETEPSLSDRREPRMIPETKMRPIYPAAEWSSAADRVKAIYQCVVQEDGALRIGALLRKEGVPHRFDLAARMALSFWRYEPARPDGYTAPSSVVIIVAYSK